MPDRKRLMILIETLLDYLVEDYNCSKCPCYCTEYCHARDLDEWEDWECRDGIYDWVMNR